MNPIGAIKVNRTRRDSIGQPRPLRNQPPNSTLAGLSFILFSRPNTGDSAQIVLLYDDKAALYKDWHALGCWQRTLAGQRGRPRSVHTVRYERQPDGTPWFSLARRFYHPKQGGWEIERLTRSYYAIGGPSRSKVARAIERSADLRLVFVLCDQPLESGGADQAISDIKRRGTALPAPGTAPVKLGKASIFISGNRIKPGTRQFEISPNYPRSQVAPSELPPESKPLTVEPQPALAATAPNDRPADPAGAFIACIPSEPTRDSRRIRTSAKDHASIRPINDRFRTFTINQNL